MSRKLLFLFAVAIQAQASFISYIASTTSPVTTGNHVAFAGVLDLPAFDPALGTLNAVNISIFTHESYSIETLARSQNESVSDWIFRNQVSLLGLDLSFNSGGYVGGFGGQICDAGCMPTNSWYFGIQQARGSITEDGSTFNLMYPGVSRSGALPSSLAGFTGTLPLELPILFSADPTVWSPYGRYGNLTAASASVGVSMQYDYTPIQAAHAPEPGTLLLIAAAIMLMVGRRRRI